MKASGVIAVLGLFLGGWGSDALAEQSSTSRQGADETGRIIRPGTAASVTPQTFAPIPVCIEFSSPSNDLWLIQLFVSPATFPFKIVAGEVLAGSLCGTPDWSVNKGTIGNTIEFTAILTAPHPECGSPTANFVGNFVGPAAYVGTYGFPENNMFPHRMIFKGWNTHCQ